MNNNITDEEITRLAREYAEISYNRFVQLLGESPNPLNKETCIETEATSIVQFMHYLLRDYFVVKKLDVLKIYHGNENTKRYTSDPIIEAMSRAENTLLEDLFGDTLKEQGGENGED